MLQLKRAENLLDHQSLLTMKKRQKNLDPGQEVIKKTPPKNLKNNPVKKVITLKETLLIKNHQIQKKILGKEVLPLLSQEEGPHLGKEKGKVVLVNLI